VIELPASLEEVIAIPLKHTIGEAGQGRERSPLLVARLFIRSEGKEASPILREVNEVLGGQLGYIRMQGDRGIGCRGL